LEKLRSAPIFRGALIVLVLVGESSFSGGLLTRRKWHVIVLKSAKKRPALPAPPAKMVH
jgi:hypothetical protein